MPSGSSRRRRWTCSKGRSSAKRSRRSWLPSSSHSPSSVSSTCSQHCKRSLCTDSDGTVDWRQKVKEILSDILPSCLAEAGLGVPPAAPPAPTPAPHSPPQASAVPSTSTASVAVFLPPEQPTRGGTGSEDKDEASFPPLSQVPPPSSPPSYGISPLASVDFLPLLPFTASLLLWPQWTFTPTTGSPFPPLGFIRWRWVSWWLTLLMRLTWERLGSRDGGFPEVLYRAKPLSTPTPLPTKLSPTATLDAVSVLLNNPRATTSQSHSIDSSGDTPSGVRPVNLLPRRTLSETAGHGIHA
ncbi:uncharacterized protein LOC123514960 isoform X2 [Portunus trituberculatus]|uniref:uncharacterized protein LOC123514960 isoform X2 n=1 Tax=Portunus trituberculatus TaxID=210409 RepID=UPI001E1CCBD6|nr:uncharacterized protein LOC123514960 isoform X2 [Portunus trituberculatus]